MWDILLHWSLVCDVVTPHSNAGGSKEANAERRPPTPSFIPIPVPAGLTSLEKNSRAFFCLWWTANQSTASRQPCTHTGSRSHIFPDYCGSLLEHCRKHFFSSFYRMAIYFIDFFFIQVNSRWISQALICKHAKHKTDILYNRVHLHSKVNILYKNKNQLQLQNLSGFSISTLNSPKLTKPDSFKSCHWLFRAQTQYRLEGQAQMRWAVSQFRACSR